MVVQILGVPGSELGSPPSVLLSIGAVAAIHGEELDVDPGDEGVVAWVVVEGGLKHSLEVEQPFIQILIVSEIVRDFYMKRGIEHAEEFIQEDPTLFIVVREDLLYETLKARIEGGDEILKRLPLVVGEPFIASRDLVAKVD